MLEVIGTALVVGFVVLLALGYGAQQRRSTICQEHEQCMARTTHEINERIRLEATLRLISLGSYDPATEQCDQQ